MAKRSRAAKEATNRDDDRGDDFAPPDRADQIPVGSGEAEEIDIFSKGGKETGRDDDHEDELPGRDHDGARAPDVETRENRQRDDDDDQRLERRDPDERRAARGGQRDEDGEYSKKVQRRINREVALRKRSDARLLQERTARQALEDRLAKLERTHVDAQGEASLKDLEAKIRDTAAKLAAAKDANETAREVELQVELAELQGQKATLKAKIERDRDAVTARAQADPSDKEGADDDAGATRGRSADWIRSQRRWWNTARWKDAKADAIAHDTTILQEIDDGELDFEAYSDEHLEELSRRLKSDYPDLEIRTIEGDVFEDADLDDDDYRSERMGNRRDDDRDDDDRRPTQRRGNDRRRAPMGGLGGREGRRERNEVEMARRGKVTLTEADFATMRVFKLDPNNPEHKKAFASQRARTLLRESQNGATRR